MPLNLSALTAKQQAAAIYIGYYDRAPDPYGLDFWESNVANPAVPLSDIATYFSAQEETYAEHPFFVSPSADAANAFISELYINLFNRMPDTAGLEFWSDVLQDTIDGTGPLSVGQIVLEIIKGAQGDDLTIIENKIEVATAWAESAAQAGLTEPNSFEDSASAQASAKSILDGVTADATTVDAAKTTLETAFDDVSAGQTFTLTTNIDAGADFTGTANNDKFIGTVGTGATTQVADQIDGGAGTDRLEIYSDGAAAVLPTLTSIEDLYIKSVAGNDIANLDYASVTALKTIELDTGETVASTATVAAGQTLTLDSIKDGDTADEGNDDGELEINSAATVTAVSLVVDDAGASGVNADLDLEVLGTGVETIDLKSSNNASVISLRVNGTSALTDLNISGDADLTITNNIDFAGTTSGTVNASAASGDLSLQLANGEAITFTGGSGENTVVAGAGDDNLTGGAADDTFTTGAGDDTVSAGDGDDTIIVAGNLTKDDTIDGGAGDEDTIVTDDDTIDATEKAEAAGVSNVEVFGTSATAAVSVDFAALADFNIVALTGENTGGVTVTGAENDDSLILASGASIAVDAALADAISVTPELDGGSNAFTIKLVDNADITGGASTESDPDITGGNGITAENIETLNLVLENTDTTDDTVTIAGGGTAGESIAIGSNSTINVSGEGDAELGTIDGTNVTINAGDLTGAITVTTSSGNTNVTGGSGDDNITGGAGVDTFLGGAGDDTIDGGGGKDIMTGGAGKDTFKVTAGDGVTEVTDVITDFELDGGDKIDMAKAVVIGDKSSTDVSGAVDGATELNATVTDGIISLSGAGVSEVDTVAELIEIFELVDSAETAEFGAIELDGNTFVIGIDAEDGVNEVVQLTGVTGADAISLTDASGTIFIA